MNVDKPPFQIDQNARKVPEKALTHANDRFWGAHDEF